MSIYALLKSGKIWPSGVRGQTRTLAHTHTHSLTSLRRTADNGINKCATKRISRIKTSSFPAGKSFWRQLASHLQQRHLAAICWTLQLTSLLLIGQAVQQAVQMRPCWWRGWRAIFISNRTICKSINYARNGRETAIDVQAEATAIIIVIASGRGKRSFSLVRNMRFLWQSRQASSVGVAYVR